MTAPGVLIVEFKEPYGGDNRLVVAAPGWDEGIQNLLHALLAELDDESESFLMRWDPANLVITYEPYKTMEGIFRGKS